MQLLKKDWERFANPIPVDLKMAAILLSPFTHDSIHTITLLSDGCVNSNYKVTFQSKQPAVILRIYARDQDALTREIALQRRIHQTLPIANILYNDSTLQVCPHPYAVMEWVQGELMRDVILKDSGTATTECAFAAGQLLEKLRHIPFDSKGFLNPDLSVRKFTGDEEFITFTKICLRDPIIIEQLGSTLISALEYYINTHKDLLVIPTSAQLTHGDFDPTNMLVKKVKGRYEIAALLDWEFAFSNSYFFDMGIFLRYRHRLPSGYENSFIQGFESTGFQLPEYWQPLTSLMDILCLLSLLYENRAIERPLMKQDIISLLQTLADFKR